MTIDLNLETQLALVDELRKYVPAGEQKRIGIAVAKALGHADSTGESELSCLLNKRPDAIERLLRSDRVEKVLDAICNELELNKAELLREARRAAGRRPRATPDRHPAWQELGEAAPWVDKVPGLPNGMETLRAALEVYGQRVVWLVGPAGSGKSARLWRAQQAQIGRLVDKLPDDAEPDAVWLVDEPADPEAWIAGATRCKARLVIATRAARRLRDGQPQLDLSAWTHAEAVSFLGQLGAARGASAEAFSAVDLELIDELLATDAAVHAGAIELAVALVALAREVPRPEQVERAVCSAVRLLVCETLVRIGLSPIPSLREVVRSASRRHLRTLPPVTVAWTRSELEQRCTESTRRVVRAADGLAEDGPEWLRAPLGGTLPDWFIYARLMPWQAVPALQDGAGRELLRAAVPLLGERPDWEAVIMDHATDGHAWARAVATGDVENIQITFDLVSIPGLLRALGRWPAPRDPERHARVLAIVLDWLPHGNDAVRPQLHTRVVRAIVDFVRRHPDRPLPNVWLLQRHEARWREALDQAAAVHHLQTWFDREREDLARAVTDASMSSSLGAAPGRLPTAIANGIARMLRLGEVLHRYDVRAPLRGLLEQTEARPHIDQTSVAWELGVGAAGALLRLRDAASLRSLREPDRSARSDAVWSVLSRKSHDEETVLWIADHLGERYDEVLESIVGRPDWREVAKRWALDASSSFRRHAAAGWLLRHPAAGEAEHVRWLLTELRVKDSLHYVKPALAHPDEAVGAAAIALLPRVLAELGAGADLLALVQSSFDPWPGHAEPWFAMTELARYLDEVNASGRTSSPDSIRTLIELSQRYLATASEEEAWRVASAVCSSLAAAASRLPLASLGAWVREPLGACADGPASSLRVAMARAGIINGLRQFAKDGANLDPEVLQAVADTGDSMTAIWACSLLLEWAPLTEAQLLGEWNAVSDAELIEGDIAPARFYAVQDRLRRQAPRELARALADRLLALPPELRRLGVPQISLVAMLDAGQVARLSSLFD